MVMDTAIIFTVTATVSSLAVFLFLVVVAIVVLIWWKMKQKSTICKTEDVPCAYSSVQKLNYADIKGIEAKTESSATAESSRSSSAMLHDAGSELLSPQLEVNQTRVNYFSATNGNFDRSGEDIADSTLVNSGGGGTCTSPVRRIDSNIYYGELDDKLDKIDDIQKDVKHLVDEINFLSKFECFLEF